MTNGIIIKVENIQKSKYDDRFYRGSEFPNGLKALLISDPTTDTSAASLTVGAGEYKQFDYINLQVYLFIACNYGRGAGDRRNFLWLV